MCFVEIHFDLFFSWKTEEAAIDGIQRLNQWWFFQSSFDKSFVFKKRSFLTPNLESKRIGQNMRAISQCNDSYFP